MPDLRELYEKYRANVYQPKQSATFNALTHPLETLGGVASGVGDIAKGIGGLVMDVPQALMPEGVKLPLSSRAIGPTKDIVTGEPIDNFNQRLGMLANVATFGLRNQFWNNYAKTKSYDSALMDTAYEALPLGEIKTFLTGESPTNPGTDITPEEYGKNLLMGAAKSVPVVKGANKVFDFINKGTKQPTPKGFKLVGEEDLDIAETMPTPLKEAKLGEINSKLAEIQKEMAEAREFKKPPEVQMDIMNRMNSLLDEKATLNNISPSALNEGWKRLYEAHPDLVQNHFIKSLTEMRDNGQLPERTAYQIATLMDENPAAAQTFLDVMVKNGLTPEQMGGMLPLVGEALRSTGRASGQNLRVFREASEVFYNKIFRDHPELRETIDLMRQKNVLGTEPVTWFQAQMNKFRSLSNIVRGAMVSSPVTSARNFTVGGGNFATTLFDNMVTGAWTKLAAEGRRLKDSNAPVPTLSESFFNFTNDLLTMQEVVFGGKRSLKQWFEDIQAGKFTPDKKIMTGVEPIIDWMNQYAPGMMAKLKGAPINDLVIANLFEDGLWNVPKEFMRAAKNIETVGDSARFGVSVLNTFNTMQEMFWRKYYFTNRLKQNVRRYGFENPQEMMKYFEENKKLPDRYFGKEFTLEEIQKFQESPQFAEKLNQVTEQYRLDNAKAEMGHSLSSGHEKTIKQLAAKEKAALIDEVKSAEMRMLKGENWKDFAHELSPQAQRLFGGKVEHATVAISEAVDYALKQTFAATPARGTFGFQLLKMYEDMPFLYALGTPFPRFAINSLNWIMERSPDEVANVFHKGFVDDLINMAKDPTKVADPRKVERFAKAQTGIALWGLAKGVHQSGLAGPKYYQIKVGQDENNNDIYADVRSYNPFSQFMFMEHVMKSVTSGEMPNLTAAELTEALTGLRRLNEVPIFAFPDIVRQIDASNPGAFMNSVKPIIGQYIAGGLIPFRIPLDIAGAFGNKEAQTYKDLSGNEILGPAMNNIPGLRGNLPNRPDPFSGEDSSNKYSGVRLFGPNLRAESVLEQEIARTGMPLNDLLGNFDDPEADRLVRKYIGTILNTKMEDGKTMANFIGEIIQRETANQPLELKKDILRELYTELREKAREQAMTENPYVFLEYMIRQQPESVRPILRQAVKPYIENNNAGIK